MSARAPIRKLLIANRGEIACRIIAAARELGIRSVAVYSEVDRDALHVLLADEAVGIGPAEPALSYLSIPALLEAARASGADAVHPGYGFRAESADFARECVRHGLRFVGPSPEALTTLGDKRAARELARSVGVPVVPGYEGGPEGALAAARDIGYPLLVKAALGGGGKGMQRVDDERHLGEALAGASRVAGSAFGDGSVYVERYLAEARHIEVQVLGDGQGGGRHVFERECSLQRRHQKVIEESPAPGLAPRIRERLCEAALALVRASRYASAGTAEFLVTPDGAFYFLEMNTRIQVEHPVTELVTGLDLVKAQLRLAAGEPLPAAASITTHGHAIEARLCAEDVSAGFLPQAGRLLRFDVPRYPFVRVDSGFETGSDIPFHYDSLIAKIIAWGVNREEALTRLGMVLDGTVVHGVRTNLPLLRFLVRAPEVASGALSTALLERDLLDRFLAAEAVPLPPHLVAAAAVAMTLEPVRVMAAARTDDDSTSPFRSLGAFRIGGQ